MRTGMSDMPELTATDPKMAGDPQANAAATAQWAKAYAKKPQDPKLALGLRAPASRGQQTGREAGCLQQSTNELAAEFDGSHWCGRADIAKYTLGSAGLNND
jgi:hypothetical protein